jgi:hypothetical protein
LPQSTGEEKIEKRDKNCYNQKQKFKGMRLKKAISTTWEYKYIKVSCKKECTFKLDKTARFQGGR